MYREKNVIEVREPAGAQSKKGLWTFGDGPPWPSSIPTLI